jgi:hypothetical protein
MLTLQKDHRTCKSRREVDPVIHLRKLTSSERAAILKRVKVLNAQLQSQELSIERLEELRRERAVLKARLAIGMAPRRKKSP